MRKFMAKLIKWCMDTDNATYDNIFNSIRINALVAELIDKGLIDKISYERRVLKGVHDMIGKEIA